MASEQPNLTRHWYKRIGPALIVAAVVLGPGSILTSSKVGSTFGLLGLPVVIGAAVLMIAMVALSARLGAVYENSLCDELAARLGRPAAVFIGLTLFTLVALFQSSNNLALMGGVEPMLGDGPLSFGARATTLIVANLLIIGCLYLVRNLYSSIEGVMKILMGLMTLAFLVNFVVVLSKPRPFEPIEPSGDLDWIPLLGMIGTTFSVGGAFYQAYLVKEKGWGLDDVKSGVFDSVFSISMLGIVTAIVLLTSWRVFYGNPEPVPLKSVGDVARQLEPSFGAGAKLVFCSGILAGALSSFLVNALIGGTVMSDALGKGSRLQDKWPVHLTVVALVVGMAVAIAGARNKDSIVPLITLAQACTVLGLPALAAALLYLGTRPELTGARKVPKPILITAGIGFVVACISMLLLAQKVYGKLNPPANTGGNPTARLAPAGREPSLSPVTRPRPKQLGRSENPLKIHAFCVSHSPDPATKITHSAPNAEHHLPRAGGAPSHEQQSRGRHSGFGRRPSTRGQTQGDRSHPDDLSGMSCWSLYVAGTELLGTTGIKPAGTNT